METITKHTTTTKAPDTRGRNATPQLSSSQTAGSVSSSGKNGSHLESMEFQIEEDLKAGQIEDEDEPLQHEIIVYDKDDMVNQILMGIGSEIDPQKPQSLDGSLEDSDLADESAKATILRMRCSGVLIQFPQDEFQPIIRSESKASRSPSLSKETKPSAKNT